MIASLNVWDTLPTAADDKLTQLVQLLNDVADTDKEKQELVQLLEEEIDRGTETQ